MSNYEKTHDYYNYVNNQYNQPLYDQDITLKSKIYDPYNGFIRGNMFPELYNDYKISTPIEVTPMNEQAELLTRVDALTFATVDLNLYLDVHPDDKEALALFNQYRAQMDEYTKEYEKKFGPLLLNSNSLMNCPWAWDKSPWPWENK